MALHATDRLTIINNTNRRYAESCNRRCFIINQRVCDFDGYYGTVKYVGSLAAAGIASPPDGHAWIGIEWDDANRGKHDGQVKGKRFFQTTSRTGASFLQTNRVNAGVAVDVAFRSRYTALGNASELLMASDLIAATEGAPPTAQQNGKDEQQNDQQQRCASPNSTRSGSTRLSLRSSNSSDLLVGGGSSRSSRSVELVGMKRSFENLVRYQAPKVVDLALSYVNDAVPNDAMASLVPRCSELALRNNLISSFDTVSMIVDGLSQLDTLDISGNLFTSGKEFSAVLPATNTTVKPGTKPPSQQHHQQQQQQQRQHSSLRTLVIDKCHLSWPDIERLLTYFTNVDKLIAGHNLIDDIYPLSRNRLNTLTYVDLQFNRISSWSNVEAALSRAPLLTDLNVSFNLVTKITIDNNIDKADDTAMETDAVDNAITALSLWPSLHTLALRSNQIADWRSVSELRKMPKMRSLVLSHNPVLNGTDDIDAADAAKVDGATNAQNNTDAEIQKPTITPPAAALISMPPPPPFADRTRLWIIAKIPQLSKLNNSEINVDERKGAELIYIKHYGPKWATLAAAASSDDAAAAAQQQFLMQHPTLPIIAQKHKFTRNEFLPRKNSNADDSKSKLSDRLLKVKVSFRPTTTTTTNKPGENDNNDGCVVQTIAVTPNMSVAKFKRLVEKKFSLNKTVHLEIEHETSNVILEENNAISSDNVAGGGDVSDSAVLSSPLPSGAVKKCMLVLDQDQATIGFYGIVNGHNIFAHLT